MSIEMTLKGFKELDNELKNLVPKMQKKAIAQATRAGANVVRNEAKRLAPRRVNSWEGMKYPNKPGNLKRSIVTRKNFKNKNRNLDAYVVTFTGRAYYGMWVELGHLLVRKKGIKRSFKYSSVYSGNKVNTRKGEVIGFVAARPFLRPAFDKNTGKVIETVRSKLSEFISKYKRGSNG